MSRHSSRRRRARIRRVKAFFRFLRLLIVVAVLAFGALFVLMSIPGDEAAPLTVQPTVAPVQTEPPATPQPTEAPTEAPTPAPTEAPTATPEPTPRAATFRVGGDVMASEGQLAYALKAGGGDSYDFAPQFELIADVLADADYTMLNLETTIGMYKDQPYSGYPQFNTPESLLTALKDTGCDFLTLANNHMLDRWFDGMKNTVASVEAAGFDHSGAYVSQEARDAATVVEVNGIRVGFLSYTEGTNGMEAAADEAAKLYGVPYLNGADFEGDVAKLRSAGAEIVIAFPHWGVEYDRQPHSSQIMYARQMAGAGVDVILGSHPHVLQKVEWMTVDGHNVLVAYSLGNFVSTQTHHGYTDTGMILEFTVRETQSGELEITDVGYVPTYCWKHDDTLQVVPSAQYLTEKPEGMSSSAYERMKTSFQQTRSLIDDSIPVVD